MKDAAVIIPNWNGMNYLPDCLASLQKQTSREFEVILVDNGSEDGSAAYVRENFPLVRLVRFQRNTGFCHAVNTGIRLSKTPYVILLNNDVVCEPGFVEELLAAIRRHPKAFSCQAMMLQMDDPDRIDDAGDLYCALGWAFARGKGAGAKEYQKEDRIFAACGGAAIYRREFLDRIGLFDEAHFAYLEDIDLGYRALRAGYDNYFAPRARLLHAGSASSGSRYNAFKVEHTSRNSVYLIGKNMPLWQLILNLPFLAAGFAVKAVFFARRGFFRLYGKGLLKGLALARSYRKGNPGKGYGSPLRLWKIQLQLWRNLQKRVIGFDQR